MITYIFNGEEKTLIPNDQGEYRITGLTTIEHKRPFRFVTSSNGAWSDQYEVRGKGKVAGTWATKELALAYLPWMGATSVTINGSIIIVVKPKRAEDEFGTCIVDKMFANYTVVRQYQVLNYRIDFYIPELNIAVEYDEHQHKRVKIEEADAIREAEIKRELGCVFIRVPH